MKDPFARTIVILAASEMRLADLHRFFRLAREMGPEQATRLVENVRYELEKIENSPLRSKNPNSVNASALERKSTLKRLEQLLLHEARLTKAEAVRLLLHELQYEDTSTRELPSHNKISFEKWLDRMSERVGTNTMLQIASRIRSRMAHSPSSHWPLKR